MEVRQRLLSPGGDERGNGRREIVFFFLKKLLRFIPLKTRNASYTSGGGHDALLVHQRRIRQQDPGIYRYIIIFSFFKLENMFCVQDSETAEAANVRMVPFVLTVQEGFPVAYSLLFPIK